MPGIGMPGGAILLVAHSRGSHAVARGEEAGRLGALLAGACMYRQNGVSASQRSASLPYMGLVYVIDNASQSAECSRVLSARR